MKVNSGQAPSTLIPEYIGSDFDAVLTCADNIEYIKNASANNGYTGATGYIGDTPPTQPKVGATWYCTLDGRTYTWYVDNDSSQWVDSSPQSTVEADSSIELNVNSNTDNIFALWKRSAAEAGYNLVAGSFEEGGVLTSPTDVLWHKGLGSIYSWTGAYPDGGHVVAPGTDPTVAAGYMPRTDVVLRNQLSSADGASLIGSMSYAQLRAYSGPNTTVNVWGISSAFDGAAGTFKVKSTDTTSTDNGGTILVDALGRRWYRVFSGEVYVNWFGANGDGVTDDTAAFQSALNSLVGLGGAAKYTGRHFIAGNLSIPNGVCLLGKTFYNAGNTGYINALATSGSSILLNSSATITLGNNSGIMGALLQRHGLNWYETSAINFAGTAITGVGNDCYVVGSFIAGFNQAFISNGAERVKLSDVYGDCVNGINIQTSYDKSYVTSCHFWPFVTQQSGLPASAQNRSGTAFEFGGVSSYCTFNNCFSFGYYRGFLIQDANDCVLSLCGADNNSAYIGSIGFLISGNCAGNNLHGCSASGNDQQYYFNSTNASIGNTLSDSKAWGSGVGSGTGVVVNQGAVNINGGHVYNIERGIIAVSSSAKISIDNTQFSTLILAVDANAVNNNIFVGDGCIYNSVTSIRGANVKQSVRTSGVATIAIGGSSIAIPHGLPEAPAFYTGVPVNTDLGGRDLWFGADATNLYINLSSNVTVAATIMWEARTRI